jgi:hypothetical protein
MKVARTKHNSSADNGRAKQDSQKELPVDQSALQDEHQQSMLKASDQWIAPRMFWLSVLSLLFLAGLLHLHDKPEYRTILVVCALGYLSVHPACWIESVWARRRGSRQKPVCWFYCLLPPLRLGARDHATGTRIWLPGLGWQDVEHELELRLERASSVPMIVLALMVLPLIGIEHIWEQRLTSDPLLSGLLGAATGLIWFAFAGEFILRLSIAPSKLDYCKRHWIDLAIVLLPLLAFLRALQLGRLLRLQQLTRTARVFRLRGVMLRAWRALLLVDAVNRLLNGPPGRRLVKLRATLAQKEHELEELRAEIARLEKAVAPQSNLVATPSAEAVALRPASVQEHAV